MNILGCSFDFVCLSETWLTPYTAQLIDIRNYKLFNIMRDGQRGGGVCIYINCKYDCRLISDCSFCGNHVESIFVEKLLEYYIGHQVKI